ncbi:hypothetical protein G5714_021919 [Onychostoma macrolepis]|uniref:Uncharacterized protein n=1 Tax=Onychostoma macrolepis TaxID=369639 RepID=A0A7J6BT31_9TELE|nr:hypothetical protein G5714_021919 [Onychostoma macrolepis]
MEFVKEIVQKAMPSLSNDRMDSLMARLALIGVNGVDDLSFETIEDVDGILPPIQCRRLIQAFRLGDGRFKIAMDQGINDHIISPIVAPSLCFMFYTSNTPKRSTFPGIYPKVLQTSSGQKTMHAITSGTNCT